MTGRDDALLAPAAVRRVEERAQQVWRVGVGVAVVLQAVLALTFGPSWPASALVLFLSVLVVSGWAWLRTARTLRAASERTREATAQHRRQRIRLEAFLDDLDPLGPTADRP